MLPARLKNFTIFVHNAAEKGILLLFATFVAIMMKNSVTLNSDYSHILHVDMLFAFGARSITMSFSHFVNDFLMAIFFFQVGMEIKREMVEGHLSTNKQRALPLIAAVGGVLLPVLMYCSVNYYDPKTLKGWAIPAATDIAFALGMLALFGKGLPTSLRIFLTALAVIDDLIAIIIIAVFYTSGIIYENLLYIGICIFVLFFMKRARIISIPVFLSIGLVMWYFFLKSGIHATISGVILGLLTPLKAIDLDGQQITPLKKLERALHPLVSYFILPVFAFVNSGLDFTNFSFESILHPVALGIMLGLIVGKQTGICLFSYVAIKFNFATKPEKSTNIQFYAISILCGIGFTMSLFIGNLSFASTEIALLQDVKVGVLLGSAMCVLLGGLVIKLHKLKFR